MISGFLSVTYLKGKRRNSCIMIDMHMFNLSMGLYDDRETTIPTD